MRSHAWDRKAQHRTFLLRWRAALRSWTHQRIPAWTKELLLLFLQLHELFFFIRPCLPNLDKQLGSVGLTATPFLICPAIMEFESHVRIRAGRPPSTGKQSHGGRACLSPEEGHYNPQLLTEWLIQTHRHPFVSYFNARPTTTCAVHIDCREQSAHAALELLFVRCTGDESWASRHRGVQDMGKFQRGNRDQDLVGQVAYGAAFIQLWHPTSLTRSIGRQGRHNFHMFRHLNPFVNPKCGKAPGITNLFSGS